MADTNKGAALLLNDAGNIDRARTTDGSIFRIESTLSMEAAEEAKTKRPKASAMTSISPTNRHRATRPRRQTARHRVLTRRPTRRCRSPTPLRKAAQEARTSRSCVPRIRSSQRFWRTRRVSSYTWAEQSTARLQRHRRAG